MAPIRRMPRGTWQAVVRRKGYSPQFRTFQTQQDAHKWARQIETEIDRTVFMDRAPSERMTMGKLIDRYLTEIVGPPLP